MITTYDKEQLMADNVEKTYPEDPNRCQATTAVGQCPNKAAEGYKYCRVHLCGRDRKDTPRMYMLTRFRDRFDRFTEIEQFKTVGEEIAILRMTLESILNTITEDELPIYVGKITMLVNGIRQTIETAERLDKRSDNYLGKASLLRFGSELVDLISTEINDVDTLERIAGKIGDLISRAEPDEADHKNN